MVRLWLFSNFVDVFETRENGQICSAFAESTFTLRLYLPSGSFGMLNKMGYFRIKFGTKFISCLVGGKNLFQD